MAKEEKMKTYVSKYTGEVYKDLAYGTLYYVPSETMPVMNNHVHAEAAHLAESINSKEDNWLQCRIEYMDGAINLFDKELSGALFRPYSMLYTPLLPNVKDNKDEVLFLCAEIQVDTPEWMERAIRDFFSSLQQILDEQLDEGTFHQGHLCVRLFWSDEPHKFNTGIRCSRIKESSPESDLSDFIMLSSIADDDLTNPPKLSRLVIRPNTYEFLLPEYNKTFAFTTQVKALYTLFLNHPEGIRMKEIADYKDEYKRLYLTLTNRSDRDKLSLSVDRLLDVCNPNALNVKKSQCNAIIEKTLKNSRLLSYYEIEVNRGMPHKINLDRSLVCMPEELQW